MKKILTYATLSILTVATVFTSCRRDEDVRVTGITLSENLVNLPVPYTDTLVATITPANATNQTLIWTSSNDGFATVDQHGVVTAIAVGSVTITVTTEDGGFSASRTYDIQPRYFPVTGVTLSQTEWETNSLNDTITLFATIEPENASFPNVIWTSSDETVATVNEHGFVTAIGEGTATIRVELARYSELFAECAVTVELILVESITVNREDNIVLHFWGEETAGALRLISTPLPMNASDRTVVWTSSNPDVVELRHPQFSATTVVADARGVGVAILTATATDGSGVTVTRTVTVSDNPNMVPDFCLDDNMITITSARFLTDQIWTVGSQQWSDVVVSDQCVAADTEWIVAQHGGALATGWMTHCRKSAEGFGDGFSWCAVMRFRNILCPDGWRVPTAQDFINLDIALRGTGTGEMVTSGSDPTLDERLAEEWIPRWAPRPIGSWNPLASLGIEPGDFQNVGISGSYWSSTEANDASGRVLSLTLPNPDNAAAARSLAPAASGGKGTPIALRCVRDVQ